MTLPGQVFDFTVQNSTLVGMLQKLNSFTDVGFGGVLGILIMIIIAGTVFLITRNSGNERAFPVAMFVAGLIGLLLRILALINDTTFWVSIALLIVSVLLLFREQGEYE